MSVALIAAVAAGTAACSVDYQDPLPVAATAAAVRRTPEPSALSPQHREGTPASPREDTTRTAAPVLGDISSLILGVFGPKHGWKAIQVARCESSLNPRARNGDHYGLFQLRRYWHERRARRLGYSWAQMTEVLPNIRVAHDLFTEQGWTPWSCA